MLAVEVATKKVVDLSPGDREAPVFSLGGGDIDVAPDGREVAFTRNPDPADQLARSTNSDIWLASTEPGPDGKLPAPRNITSGNPAWDGGPRYSPDGKFIAYRRQQTPGYESDRFSLMLYDRATGQRRELTPDFDNWVTDVAWLPDSKGLVFKADVEGRTPLFVVGIDGGTPREAARFAQLDEYDVAPDGKSAVVVRRSVAQPAEIWRLDLAGTAPPARLTRHNEALEQEVDIRPVEELWIPGADGKKVHTFVVKPHGFDPAKKYPLVINVHGGPQMQWSDSFRGDWQVYPGAGVIVAFPNPHGSTGYGQAYTAAISGDWGGKVMEDIRLVTAHLAALPYVDRERIGAMGWSWGGYAMYWLLGQETPYKAFAAMMGVFNPASMYGATEELWFPEWELKGTPWNSAQYETLEPGEERREVEDADADRDRREGLPDHLLREPAGLHRAAAAGDPGPPDRAAELRPLALVVRDGALLHRAPGLVPSLPGRRSAAVERGGLRVRPGLRPRDRQKETTVGAGLRAGPGCRARTRAATRGGLGPRHRRRTRAATEGGLGPPQRADSGRHRGRPLQAARRSTTRSVGAGLRAGPPNHRRERHMPIAVGSKAPDFTLKTKTAAGVGEVKLSENFGRKNTVLLFFPLAFTGVCTQEMCDITAGFGAYESLNADIIGVSIDSPFSQEAWAIKEGIRVKLASDLNKSAAKAYGVLLEDLAGFGATAARAAFVIDKAGVVRYAEQTPTPGDLPNFEAVQAALKSL